MGGVPVRLSAGWATGGSTRSSASNGLSGGGGGGGYFGGGGGGCSPDATGTAAGGGGGSSYVTSALGASTGARAVSAGFSLTANPGGSNLSSAPPWGGLGGHGYVRLLKVDSHGATSQ